MICKNHRKRTICTVSHTIFEGFSFSLVHSYILTADAKNNSSTGLTKTTTCMYSNLYLKVKFYREVHELNQTSLNVMRAFSTWLILLGLKYGEGIARLSHSFTSPE